MAQAEQVQSEQRTNVVREHPLQHRGTLDSVLKHRACMSASTRWKVMERLGGKGEGNGFVQITHSKPVRNSQNILQFRRNHYYHVL